MPKHGKKYLAAAEKVDRKKLYSRDEAVALIKETAYTKFDPTVEVHFNLGVDPRKAEQMVRDVVVLPHGLGKTVKILVFADGEDATIAKEAGAFVEPLIEGADLLGHGHVLAGAEPIFETFAKTLRAAAKK